MNRRQQKIIELLYLSKEGRAVVNDLAEQLNVSTVTIRQDLNYLEEQGFLKRVHGGAALKDADDISKRLMVNYDKKLAIARKAASFVTENDTILIESGSTNAILVKELERSENINIITTNVFIAHELRRNAHPNIFILGGSYQQESESLVGSLTKLCLENVHFSKAFVGVDGFTKASGFTSSNMMRAEISAEIVKKAKEVFVLTDSSKFGKVHLARLFRPEDIAYLITDNGIPEDDRQYIEERGVRISVV